jgi:hypothetical protein
MERLQLTEREGTSIIFNVANITYIKISNAGLKVGTVDGKEVPVKEDIAAVNKQLDDLRKSSF